MQHASLIRTLRNHGFSFVHPAGPILLEKDDEWTVPEHRCFSAESMARLTAPPETDSTHE
jgi:hypothetical protein